MFSCGGHGQRSNASGWNHKYAGNEAFACDDGSGYNVGQIFNKQYKAHRTIWAMHYGTWPDREIDHINQDRSDNRISNLRIVTSQENNRNRSMTPNNTSGHVGVYWDKNREKWAAQIMVSGKNKFIGYFTDIEDAAAARTDANAKYGFHINHGACNV